MNKEKIAVWGKGKEGSSLLNYFIKNRIEVSVLEGKNIDLKDYSLVFKSPGISFYNDCLQEALKAGVRVSSSTNLFMEKKKGAGKTIAITGTKGKSTTSALLAHILKEKGKNVLYGGNIGKPLIDLVDENFDYCVAELSSYQCTDLQHPFDVSVVLNLYPEHIDWHGSHDRYYEDKLNLIKHRKDNQVAILNWQNKETLLRTSQENNVLFFNHPSGIHLEEGWFKDGHLKLFKTDAVTNLKGVHNLENICAVLTVLKFLKFDLTGIEKDIATFKALPHRLEILGTFQEVLYVDDSISTTPETSVAALKAFSTENHIFLLVGGYDRNQKYDVLLDYVRLFKEKITLVTLPITGKRIVSKDLDILPAKDIKEAVKIAQAKAKKGDVVLLSPGAPSYHAYKNFEERGLDFKNSIR